MLFLRLLASSYVISRHCYRRSNQKDNIARQKFHFRPFCSTLTEIREYVLVSRFSVYFPSLRLDLAFLCFRIPVI